MRGASGGGRVPPMASSAPFFHLDALRRVLDGTASSAASGAGDAIAPSIFPLPHMTAGALLWPQEHALRVLHEWAEWTRTLPEDVTTTARLVRYPRLPGVPAVLRGRAFVAVEVAIPREPWVAEGRLAALRRLNPEIDTVVLTNPSVVPSMHLRLVLPDAAIGRHEPIDEITAATIDAFVAAAGPSSGSGLASAELRHLRGARAVSASARATSEEDESRHQVRLDHLVERVAGRAPGAANGRYVLV
jgi:hypothetical protein